MEFTLPLSFFNEIFEAIKPIVLKYNLSEEDKKFFSVYGERLVKDIVTSLVESNREDELEEFLLKLNVTGGSPKEQKGIKDALKMINLMKQIKEITG